ncbi:hypothetical protein CEXT_156061 [Caerostris extrusa]|uniref:Uncharacterized protein n=1 Tax=Caerostris extrusa TaxID=172846 RepID=A0AAV4Q7U2_CAEEX|nr:hypothetical protein CEXT_156061 [Caerostris extrusa]
MDNSMFPSKFIVTRSQGVLDLLSGQEFHRNLQEMNPQNFALSLPPARMSFRNDFEKKGGGNLPPPSDYNCMRLQRKYS